MNNSPILSQRFIAAIRTQFPDLCLFLIYPYGHTSFFYLHTDALMPKDCGYFLNVFHDATTVIHPQAASIILLRPSGNEMQDFSISTDK